MGREGEREGEKMCVCLSHAPYWGPDPQPRCPHWESNLQPFGSQPALNPLSYTSQGKCPCISKP